METALMTPRGSGPLGLVGFLLSSRELNSEMLMPLYITKLPPRLLPPPPSLYLRPSVTISSRIPSRVAPNGSNLLEIGHCCC